MIAALDPDVRRLARDHEGLVCHGPAEVVATFVSGGEIYNVFTIENDRINQVEDYLHRDEALAAAGLTWSRSEQPRIRGVRGGSSAFGGANKPAPKARNVRAPRGVWDADGVQPAPTWTPLRPSWSSTAGQRVAAVPSTAL